MVTIPDRKRPYSNDNATVDHYYLSEQYWTGVSDVAWAGDYAPFGMQMVSRTYSNNSSSYRYGFNGKENDNEVKGQGNQQDYGMRIYDPRLGRFLSIDPIAKSYPWNSTYAYAENDVIRSVDLDGGERKHYLLVWDENHKDATLQYLNTTDFTETTNKWTPTFTDWGKTTTTTVKNPRVEYVVHGFVKVPMSGDGMFPDEVREATWTFKTAEEMFGRENARRAHAAKGPGAWGPAYDWGYESADQRWSFTGAQLATYGLEAQVTKQIYSPNVFRGTLKGNLINIYGEGEAPGFKDYATEAAYRTGNNGVERPLTSTIESRSASVITINSAPLSPTTLNEITRLSKSGTIISYTTGAGSPQLKALAAHLGESATQVNTINFTLKYEGYSTNMTTVTYKMK